MKKVVIEDLNINIHDLLCMCTKFPYETLISESFQDCGIRDLNHNTGIVLVGLFVDFLRTVCSLFPEISKVW